MEFPRELRGKIRELVERENFKELSAAAKRLSENYRRESENGKISARSKTDILAYAAVRMPATFAAVSRALELALECFDKEIFSVADAGAGTGAGAAAASLLIDDAKIVCVEREPEMTALGRELLNSAGISAEWKSGDISRLCMEKADLVICSYCLNELSESARKTALLRLSNAAAKLLLIVEPGTPASFSTMKKMRAELIKDGWNIIAPCTHKNECPLPENDWCHFTARAARTDFHRQLKGGSAPFEDEKFCFAAFSREDFTISPTAISQGRILRHPITEKQKITLKICSENGISAKIITGKEQLFKRARKAKTGDLFPSVEE